MDAIRATLECKSSAVEISVFAEMFFLRDLPAAEDFVDRKERRLGEVALELLKDLFGVRAIVILGDQFLRFGRIEVVQVFFWWWSCTK